MRIDKNCRYCGADRIRAECGGYIVCGCSHAKLEWMLSMEKESLKKRVVELSNQISDLKKEHSQSHGLGKQGVKDV